MAIYIGTTRQKLWVDNNSYYLKIIPAKTTPSNNIFLKTSEGEFLTSKDGSHLTITKED